MVLDIKISGIACPGCGTRICSTFKHTAYPPDPSDNSLQAVKPKDFTCDSCSAYFEVVASVIISVDAKETPAPLPLVECTGCHKQRIGGERCEQCYRTDFTQVPI